MAARQRRLPPGFGHWPGKLTQNQQRDLVRQVMARVKRAPFYTPCLPRTGKPMRVKMTNFGTLGWVTDKAGGYRYERCHPVTGAPWPGIPAILLDLWDELCEYHAVPEACLVNAYGENGRLGLHVDGDEEARDAPVLSVSLGDRALFRIGGRARGDPTSSLWLESGDVMMLSGPARHCHHGIDRIAPGTSRLIPGGGRINLTLRRASLPEDGWRGLGK